MSSGRRRRLRALLTGKNPAGSEAPITKSQDETPAIIDQPIEYDNPVENYYRHKIKNHLPVFYRFALQTRSLAIRDVFAKGSSRQSLDLADLLTVLQSLAGSKREQQDRSAIELVFDGSVLLTLADLLANTAQDDLDTYAAAQIYDFVLEGFGDEVFQDQHKLQYVEALNELGRYEQSEQLSVIFQLNEIAPLQQELLHLQRVRRTASSVEEWLNALNTLYTTLGMTKVKLRDDKSLPLIDRLTAETVQSFEGPKVSVIMPTFSPGPGIRTAIRGLLDQSWQNLEIIVVDDASPDEYCELFDEIEGLDPRIQLLRQEQNAGAYVARNAGLAIATGEFITTHDDDDWSHPDKIARQVRVLLDDHSIVATTSAHIRTTEDIEFRRVNMHARFMQMNYSSLMFRRSIVEDIGKWDTVNKGGDSEFFLRLLEFVGSDRVVSLLDRPLSFSRVWDGSLTSGEMSRGFFAYSRLLYRWAFRQWQWDQGKLGLEATRRSDTPRPYAIPTTFESGKRAEDLGLFDVIYVTDFFRQAKYVDYVLKEIETLADYGLRIGYLHLYSPETTRPAGFPNKLFELQLENRITQVSHDDIAETKLLLVYDAAVGMFADEIRSSIVSRRSLVVEHGLPTLARTELRNPTYVPQALQNLDRCFDTVFKIVGASSEDQARLAQFVPSARLLSDKLLWKTHLREETMEIRPPGDTPVVGFHSYGNHYRWPNSVGQLISIYNSPKFLTRFYGHLESAIKKFGPEAFQGSEIADFDQTEQEFLWSIDFWVYFPHYRLEDQIWEPVLNAMQAGKVVILPGRLAPLYGDAAVYTEPSAIEKTVTEFSSEPQQYIDQAEQGQRFVQSLYNQQHLLDRVKKVLNGNC